jgi:plasmid stabilization system protein ParE
MTGSNYQISLNLGAIEDIDAAAKFYFDQQPELATRFLQAVQNVFQLIAQFPQAHPQIEANIRRVSTKSFPFYVYYTFDSDIVRIFAVLHTRRNPNSWQQRLE